MSESEEAEGEDILTDADGEVVEEPDPLEDLLVERDEQENETQETEAEELVDFATPSRWERVKQKAGNIKKAVRKLAGKVQVTDDHLAWLSDWSEYLMFAFIVAAILTVVTAGITLAVFGAAMPVMLFVQVFVGTIVSAVGFLGLLIVFSGGADYLAARVR